MHPAKNSLNYLDFVILSLIFFGYFSYASVLIYLSTPVQEPVLASSFDSAANWGSVITELVLLAIALPYLIWRKFDFSQIDFSVNKNTLPIVIFLITIGALTCDLILYGGYWLLSGHNPFADMTFATSAGLLSHINFGLLIFAFVNGFFEELYFLGLAFSVRTECRLLALITSVLVRFVFHIYQGLLSALAIAFIGVVFILLRRKIKSITPFILTHAVFDIFGAGLVSLLFAQV